MDFRSRDFLLSEDHMTGKGKRVTIYLGETDKCHHQPRIWQFWNICADPLRQNSSTFPNARLRPTAGWKRRACPTGTQKWNTSVSPVPEGFLDRFLPVELRKQRLQKRLSEELETLVTHNVENLRWATLRNLDDAFRRFSLNLEERLKETAEATRRAMRATHLRKKTDEDLTQAELEHLKRQAAGLAGLEDRLLQYADSLQRK
jgi:hypothetical protein